ncbi:cupin domain-containing protein [Ignavibacterium album]|uniref:cupin domain-containing protein n=1 Tax=Ignavibacterium album TaxID=591197 RepID=UPI0035B98532
MRLTKYLFLIFFGIMLTLCSTVNAQKQPKEIKIKNLLLESLAQEFTPDREVRIDLVEFPPDTLLDWHWHPGEEFHYYLEGEVEIQIEGQPPIIGKPGMLGHVPFKVKHRAVTHVKGAKVLVFRVHTKGEPWKYDFDEHHK